MLKHPALQSAPNLDKSGWQARHKSKLQEIARRQSSIDCVFIGDSIFEAWESLVPSVWNRYFAELGALNLGFGGDRTEHLLWRIENGELDGYSAGVIVLLIGTNNTGHRKDPPQETAAAITSIISLVRKLQPSAQILLHAILPRGKRPTHPLRCINDTINQNLQHLNGQNKINWLDLSNLFLDEKGFVPEGVMDDFLHPNQRMYEPWAQAMLPMIKKLSD